MAAGAFTKLEHARLRAGYATQQALADATGVARPIIGRIESPNPAAVRRLADHLGLEPGELAEPAQYTPEAHAALAELAAEAIA